jgi:hypothetical protein
VHLTLHVNHRVGPSTQALTPAAAWMSSIVVPATPRSKTSPAAAATMRWRVRWPLAVSRPAGTDPATEAVLSGARLAGMDPG